MERFFTVEGNFKLDLREDWELGRRGEGPFPAENHWLSLSEAFPVNKGSKKLY